MNDPAAADTGIDLPAIMSRNDTARQVIAAFITGMPPLSGLWRRIGAALEDTPVLAARVTMLAAELKEARLDLADMLAAARATLAAHADGETDPLWYLRDELDARPACTRHPRRPA
ncbi:MAG TPA: hypothetical protein VN969_22890 [Streptosporangiaceae bacterium]|nr:hypothetical protein [Streptosporangiaceae bacterium]